MAARSSVNDWGTVAKFLHWTMALGILTMIGCGIAMHWLLDRNVVLKFAVYQFHKSLGFLLLCLAVLRIAWRLTANEMPTLPNGTPGWRRWFAGAVHVGLYICLIVQPLIGWIVASASPLNIPTIVFGLFTLPRLGLGDVFLETWSALAHSIVGYALTALIAVHVAGAGWHHLVERDDTLRRMAQRSKTGSLQTSD